MITVQHLYMEILYFINLNIAKLNTKHAVGETLGHFDLRVFGKERFMTSRETFCKRLHITSNHLSSNTNIKN